MLRWTVVVEELSIQDFSILRLHLVVGQTSTLLRYFFVVEVLFSFNQPSVVEKRDMTLNSMDAVVPPFTILPPILAVVPQWFLVPINLAITLAYLLQTQYAVVPPNTTPNSKTVVVVSCSIWQANCVAPMVSLFNSTTTLNTLLVVVQSLSTNQELKVVAKCNSTIRQVVVGLTPFRPTIQPPMLAVHRLSSM